MSCWLVSACLLGRACRYDGQSKGSSAVQLRVLSARARGVVITPVCPEELGGLQTPRPPADLRDGAGQSVWEGRATVRRLHDDLDLSDAFMRGAEAALSNASGATHAILKARSPSCGVGQTYINGALSDGDGVFAALLRARGISLSTEE